MNQNRMNRNKRGFTLIEVTVVLVLISIIAAAVFARSISTNQITVVGEVDKIRNHIRYAQSLAMKRGEIRGFKCDGLNPDSYWMFTGADPDNESNQIALPGLMTVKVSLPELFPWTRLPSFLISTADLTVPTRIRLIIPRSQAN